MERLGGGRDRGFSIMLTGQRGRDVGQKRREREAASTGTLRRSVFVFSTRSPILLVALMSIVLQLVLRGSHNFEPPVRLAEPPLCHKACLYNTTPGLLAFSA